MAQLKKNAGFKGVKGPLLTIVMDGVGIAPDNGANAVATALTPNLDRIMKNYPTLAMKAVLIIFSGVLYIHQKQNSRYCS